MCAVGHITLYTSVIKTDLHVLIVSSELVLS